MADNSKLTIEPFGEFNPKSKSGFYIKCNKELLHPDDIQMEIAIQYGQYADDYTLLAKDLPFDETIKFEVDITEENKEYFKSSWKIVIHIKRKGWGFTDSYIQNTYYTESLSSPIILQPQKEKLDVTNSIEFSWEHRSSFNFLEYGYDLEYSYDNYTWQTLNSVSSINNYNNVEPIYNSLPNKFNKGNIYWRVRTYGTWDEPSEWAYSFFIATVPLIPPNITNVTTTPKIKITWNSAYQIAFRVKSQEFDSGPIFSKLQEFSIPKYFNDGNVKVMVSIANVSGNWSKYSEAETVIENKSTGEIDLIVSSNNDSANLNWSSDTEFISFYVLRGGIPIAKTTDLKEYTDYTSVGANEYQIMGITADGYYTMSNVVPVSVFPKTAVIGILSNTVSWVTLTYRRGNLPEIITSSSEEVYYQYYSGRKLPVAYSSRFKTKKKTLNFTVYKQDADAIENMIGQTVIYKDYAENKIIGIVNDVETSSNASRPDVRLEITAIDYLEDVGYD